MGYSRPPYKVSSLYPIQTGQSTELLADNYLQVVQLHGVTVSIVPDTRFFISLLEKSSREPGDTTEV